jgi:hypothetical protein
LTNLLCKGVPFVWTDRAQKAFDTLKTKLTEAPVLQSAKMDLPFTVITDASIDAIGAVLSQDFGHG